MKYLAEIMNAREAELLKAIYREPSVTAYNRLEPRTRSENFDRSLRAEIRDPLWMLTRQWQMGELEAEDCGSAIDARLLTKHTNVDRIALKNNPGHQYTDEVPMEAFVEREAIPFTWALKIQTAQYFLQLHLPALKSKYLPQYQLKFKLPQDTEEQYKGQVDSLNILTATLRRALDGEKIYKSVTENTFDAEIAVDPADGEAINDIKTLLQSWFRRLYTHPENSLQNAWSPRQLDYQFSLGAPDTGNKQLVLRASQYYQGRLDWYAFDEELRATPITTDQPDTPAEIEDIKPVSFIPTPTAFKGMPQPRFWEMEERQINFGKFNAKTTDLLLLLFAEFGLVYGNDWFVIPYKMPVNTLCEIKGLVVTDVFGERTFIETANGGQDSEWQRWSMFNLSNKDHIGSYNKQLFLPSALTHALESEPIEQVNFIRDEMANLVWGIEDTITDATGKGINGHEVANKTAVLPTPITESPAKIRYLLGTTVPENWIPFLPVHKPGSVQEIQFQRASMPKIGVPPKEVIKAKGVLLNEVDPPYFINEEEIPYAGTIITRSYQRARWYNGRTFIWIGRYRETGRGQGSSKLRFDQIEPIK